MGENRPGRVIAYRPDRLGARLNSLMNAMRIAEDMDALFRCAWIESSGVGSVFNDPTELYEPEFVSRHFLTPAEWKAARPRAIVLRTGAAHSKNSLRAILESGKDVIVGNAFGVIALTGEKEDEILPRFRWQFRRIPLAAPVQNAMSRIRTEVQGHTAYHVRRGDLTSDLKAMNKAWPHKMVPNEFYEAHIRDRLDAAGGAMLFSDDPATINHFRRRFPALKAADDLPGISELTEAQRDLSELYAMGCCETIIAPEHSAFSAAAADLFGAAMQPVADALGAGLRDEAFEALLQRIEAHPETFSGDGEIGQCLVHLGDWLERSERQKVAARVLSNQVRRGLNSSFVYPRTLKYLHDCGDLPGVLEVSKLLPHRHIVHAKDRVNAEILHGWGHIRNGGIAQGLRHIANGFWHGPAAALARTVAPLMVELGWYDHSNFLPMSAFQRYIDRRRGPARTLSTDLPGIDRCDHIAVPNSLPRLETAIWDWAPLLRSASTKTAARTGAVSRTMAHLREANPGSDRAWERASQVAILQAFSGNSRSGCVQLETLAKNHPEDWQVWQRLSHLYWGERDLQRAADAATRALDCLVDAPVLMAWTGMISARCRQWDEAITLLRDADSADIGFPNIPALYAEVQDATGDQKSALATIRRARRLAPEDPQMAIFEAGLLERSGKLLEATRVLETLVEWQRATPNAFVQLVSLLRQTGDTARAAEVARIAELRFPDKPAIIALRQDLVA